MAEAQALSEGKPKVFISYSRKDRDTVEQLRNALIATGFEAYLDLHDILPSEPWQERLSKLIAAADSVIFALSPHSVASDIVDWEVNEAERLGKRILPVVIRDAEPDGVPGRIKRLNYIFVRDPSEWASGLAKLDTALLTDIDWIREHTRLGELAQRWQDRGRPRHLLLTGRDIEDAERWALRRPREAPLPTDLHSAFVTASRQGATRWQRIWIAGALAVALISGGLATVAAVQRGEAIQERNRATGAEQRVRTERDRAVRSQFLSLSANAKATAARGLGDESENKELATLLLIEALSATVAAPSAVTDRALLLRAEHQLIDLVIEQDKAGVTIDIGRVPEGLEAKGGLFDKSGRRLFGLFDKAVAVWDATSGGLLALHQLPFKAEHAEAHISPSGQSVAIKSTAEQKRKDLLLLSSESGLAVSIDGRETLSFVAFSDDGRFLVAEGTDDKAVVIDTKSGQRKTIDLDNLGLDHQRRPLSPDGKRLIGMANRSAERNSLDARIVDVETGAVVRSTAIADMLWVTSQFSLDGQPIVAIATEDGVSVDRLDGSPRFSIAIEPGDNNLAYWLGDLKIDPSGKRMLVPSKDGLALVNVATGDVIRRVGASTILKKAQFSSDGRLGMSAEEDDQFSLWLSDTGKEIARFNDMDSASLDDVIRVSKKAYDVDKGGEYDEYFFIDTRTGSWSASPAEVGAIAVADREIVYLWGENLKLPRNPFQVRRMPLAAVAEPVIDYARRVVSRCLTTTERAEAYLDSEPPDWCIEMRKKPYEGESWMQRLADKRGGKRPADEK